MESYDYVSYAMDRFLGHSRSARLRLMMGTDTTLDQV